MKETDMLHALVEVAGEHARLCLVEFKFRSLFPSWLIVTGEDQIEIIATPWENDHQKHKQTMRIKKRLKQTRAKAYSLVCEAWVAIYKDEPGSHGFIRPAQRADRQEVVMVVAVDRTRAKFGRWKIVRAPTTEQIIGLERNDFDSEWGQPESWMAHLLEEEP